MPELMVPVLIVAGVAAVGLAVWWHYKQEKERREALFALAQKLGWRFDPSRDTSHDNEYSHFEIFRRGHSRSAHNTLTGETEIAGRLYTAKMGDFTYKVTTSNGKTTSTTTYRFSYLIVHLPFVGAPDLLIRREGLFDKLAGVFGRGSINFESEEFSRRFYVNSPDRKFAFDVVTPRMMEFLMKGKPAAVDIEQGRCCLSDGSKRWKPEEFEANLAWLKEFFALWPEHLKVSLEQRVGAGRS